VGVALKEITETLIENGQEHILEHLELMTVQQKDALINDLKQVDFKLLDSLFETYKKLSASKKEKKVFSAADVLSFDEGDASVKEKKRLYAIGEDYLNQGKIAVFLVAGGQGTRLGFDGPKGCYSISPIKGKSLFQLFSENIIGLQRRYGKQFPWYIMTSNENNEDTLSFFRKNSFFGLNEDNVRFIVQKQVPSFDFNGKLIISGDKKLLKNPNGHGGSIQALYDTGALSEMKSSGIEEIFYFQVDNPLVKIADPLFAGAHISSSADISSKVVRKTDPDERVGIIGKVDGKLGCIEYSELSSEQVRERKEDGSLLFSGGNIAIHMLNRSFVEKLNSGEDKGLSYHLAEKDVAVLEVKSGKHTLKHIKGIKPEMFIFDAFSFAKNSVTLEVERSEEFSPVKNSEGKDSPETARRAMVEKCIKWINESGKGDLLPEDIDVEISSLFAFDKEGFCDRFVFLPDASSSVYIE
jgi:UDP-N-acetylglucosamine/UDP-N-acetylgalactosamine diphosphorylase